MSTINLFLGIICFAFTSGNGMLGGRLLRTPGASPGPLQQSQRARVIQVAESELGVKEKTGNNDGPRVEEYLRYVKLKKGNPWCAAFISWVFGKAGFQKPRSGWSPDLFPHSRLARSALPGNVLGIYFEKYGRIAHVGLIIKQNGNWITSVEGNTNLAGSREGEGVYLKMRHVRTIHRIANWTAEERSVP